DQSRAISCRGRATWPRRDLFQGQGLGCPHGQGRSPDHWSEPGLVRSGRQGPDRHSEGEIANSRAAAKKHCYSIPSSARATSLSGTVRPSAFAVLRLATVSNLVGACTGRSAGFSPLGMRSIQRPMSASLIGRLGSSAFRLSTNSSVHVAHGLVLLFGLGTKGPSIMGIRRRGGTIFRATLPSM